MQGILRKIDAPPTSGASICRPEVFLPRLFYPLEKARLPLKHYVNLNHYDVFLTNL